jgi:general secretion pathway protein I
MMPAQQKTSNRGLSVIEALIAVAILGIAFSGILSWRQAALRQHQRIETQEQVNRAQRNAMALLADINPMQQPAGAINMAPGESVAWNATALTRPRPAMTHNSGEHSFSVVLYRMDVRITGESGTPTLVSFERLGWAPIDEDKSLRQNPDG